MDALFITHPIDSQFEGQGQFLWNATSTSQNIMAWFLQTYSSMCWYDVSCILGRSHGHVSDSLAMIHTTWPR